MLTDAELREIKAGAEHCERTHAGQQYPFCENYGCMSVRPLLDDIDRLRRALAEVMVPIEVLSAPGEGAWELAPEVRVELKTARMLGRAALGFDG